MGKRIFWIFILIVSSMSFGLVLYIQSDSFAKIAKKRIQSSVAREIGAELNFDRLGIGVLPPSVSLVNVELKISSPKNALGLTPSAVLRAGRLGFNFRMIQAFSRGIAVNKLFLSDGEIRFELPKGKDPRGSQEKISDLVHRPLLIKISDNFHANIRQLEVRSTTLALTWKESGKPADVSVGQIEYLAVTPAKEGTNLVANLQDAKIDLPDFKETFKTVRVNSDIERNKIFIASLDAQRRDAVVHAAGKLIGSIDKIDESRPDIDLILRGPVRELADFEKSLSQFSGEITADVKVVGRVKNPSLQGKIAIDNFRHSLWAMDKIELQGSYVPGSIVLDSLVALRGGGALSLKNQIEIPVPLRADATLLQLRFANAKFEDFAGDLLKDVNNLKMTLTGNCPVRIEFSREGGKSKLASLSFRPDLSIRDLELNNQTYGKKKEYKKIFGLTPFLLGGNVGWKNGEVRVQEAKLTFESGAVEVKGTVSDKGYDLIGTSANINLGQEVGEIGKIKIVGEGGAKIHVRGPNHSVFMDFDLKQKNAKFVNFDFGEIDGRVTYDDKNSYLYITGLRGKKNSSVYSVDGKVNVGEGDDIQLSASFSESDPNDIFAIFARQIEKISWIPHGMGGKIQGRVSVGGGYSDELSTLEIDSMISGRNLTYKGELVHEASVAAGVKKGVIYARDLKARKYDSVFAGEISYFPNDEMKYRLSVEKGKLRSLDFLTSAGLPIDGMMRFRSEGKGKWETLESKTQLEIRNAFVRTMALPPADLEFTTQAGLSLFEVSVGDSIQAKIKMAESLKEESTAEVMFDDANLAYLLCLLNRRMCTDPSVQLRAEADGQFSWKGRDWQSLSGQATIKNLQMAKTGFQLGNVTPFSLRGAAGILETGKVRFEGEDSKLVAQFKGKIDGSLTENSLQGDLSLKLFEFVTPLIEEARGKFGVDLNASGSLKDTRFSGALAFHEGFLRLGGLDAPLDALTGKIRINGNRATMDSMSGQIGGGSAQLSGGFDLYLNRPPVFALDMYLANNRLKFFPVNYAEFSEAKLSFTGDSPPYLFGGTARVKRVMMRDNFDVGGGQKVLQTARYLPEKLSGTKSLYEVRIRAVAENGVFVQNDLLDAEFRGEVTLLNNFEFPQITGRAELVRGKLLFRSTAFTLDHAFIRMPNPEFFNPQFSIGGIANVDAYRISIFASGTVDKPKITLSSSPSLPQEDIISLLAFGYRGEDARRVNPNDTSALTYSEVGSILLEQLKLSQNLQSKGVRVRVAPSISDNEANIIRPNSAPGAVSPKVYLQTQILKNLDATFGSTVGSTQGQEVDANLEYRVGKKASVSAVYEQEPGLDATEKRNSYGADLKFRWGFK